jgi:site-specific DNA-cytosine methylase
MLPLSDALKNGYTVNPMTAVGTQQAAESGQLVASPITAGYAKGVGANDGQKGNPQNLIKTRQGVRRLMPVECERLQGLPDGHTAWGINEKGERVEMSDSARYRMIGNGVSVPVIEWIAKRTRKMMESML